MADDGKRSLYSGGGDGSDRTSGGPVKIDCARCGTTSDVGIVDALKRILRFSLWIPGRTYSRRLVCPACEQRSWVRVRLT